MVREDLIEGAVSFLQDPSVASAPLEQRIAFLRSKNLTQDEIDASLSRVGQSPSGQAPPVQYRQPSPQYGNNYQQQYGYPQQWQQGLPEAPRRDWRDYFIAATVMGGVGYALYWTAKRYVYPLIAPPTPPQLEQDKAAVDASFDKAFALLEQLATDTQELKDAEASRKERLDAALAEVESAISRMKQANDEREMEAKRMAREVSEIRDQIPNAIAKEKEMTDNRLKDLHTEMKSLKTLVGNRMSGGAAAPTPGRTTPSYQSQQPAGIPPVHNPVAGPTPGQESLQPQTNGTESGFASYGGQTLAQNPPSREGAGTPYSRLVNGGKNSIPSWQLAAKKKSEEAKADGTSESGTVTDAVDSQA